jgi:hypothetical protein
MNFQENLSSKLDDLFFQKEDQKLIEQLKKIKKMEETKEALSKVSGIKNDKILEKLVKLNVRPETLASISLVPLVEIAWVDGTVDKKESDALLKAAEKMGFEKGNADHEILTQWMTHKPSADLLDAWIHYIEGLCEALSEDEKNVLQKEIMNHTKSIAEASGGFIGIGKTSKEEEQLLKVLDSAFCKSCKK